MIETPVRMSEGAPALVLAAFHPSAPDLWSPDTEGMGRWGNLPVGLLLGLVKVARQSRVLSELTACLSSGSTSTPTCPWRGNTRSLEVFQE